MFDGLRNIVFPPPLIVIGAAALYVLAWSGNHNAAIPADSTPNPTLQSDKGAEPVEITLPAIDRSQSDLQLISTQPLFNQSRQPWASPEALQPIAPSVQAPVLPEPPPQPKVEVTLSIPNLSLIGMIQDDQAARALVLDLDTLDERWLEVGDIYQSWELFGILNDRILLRAEGEEMVVLYNR